MRPSHGTHISAQSSLPTASSAARLWLMVACLANSLRKWKFWEQSLRRLGLLLLIISANMFLPTGASAQSYVFERLWPQLPQPWYFFQPWNIAIDSQGNVFVADSGFHRIQVFNSSGIFLRRWGSSGSGDGQFNLPSGVAVDASGNVFVADIFTNRIQKFVKTNGPPGAATLVSPSGSIFTSTPSYTWNAVSTATSYQLWISDATASPKIQQWYTADQAGCASGTGTCSIIHSVALAPGACQWWIQTRNSAGDGPWSSPLSFTVTVGVPGRATLVSPSGTISSTTPAYTWNAVAPATWYQLWVNDSSGSARIQSWYTAAQAGCASGTGTCSVTPATPLASGQYQWWVQTWNDSGYGPWSEAMAFTVGGAATPGKATLVSPSGSTATASPTYVWNAVSNATWYQLWVDDSSGSAKIKSWFTATQAGCSSGTGNCSITASTPLSPGACQWWIQTWNDAGYGSWSEVMKFTIVAGGITIVNASDLSFNNFDGSAEQNTFGYPAHYTSLNAQTTGNRITIGPGIEGPMGSSLSHMTQNGPWSFQTYAIPHTAKKLVWEMDIVPVTAMLKGDYSTTAGTSTFIIQRFWFPSPANGSAITEISQVPGFPIQIEQATGTSGQEPVWISEKQIWACGWMALKPKYSTSHPGGCALQYPDPANQLASPFPEWNQDNNRIPHNFKLELDYLQWKVKAYIDGRLEGVTGIMALDPYLVSFEISYRTAPSRNIERVFDNIQIYYID